MSINISVIGAGKIFQNYHLNSILKQQGVIIKYVVDKNEALCSKVAKELHATPLNDASKIDSSDICLIATPPASRRIIFDLIKDKGMDLIFEKPISFDYETAKYIIDESKKRKISVGVAHTRRFFPNLNFIRQLIQNNFFRPPINISIYEGGIFNWITESNYMNNQNSMDHGVVHDLGSHVFDYLLSVSRDLCVSADDVIVQKSVFDFDSLANNCSAEIKIGNVAEAKIKLSRSVLMMNKVIISDSIKSVVSKSSYDNKVVVKLKEMQFSVPVENEYGQGKDLEDAFDLLWQTIISKYSSKEKTNPLFSIEGESVLDTSKLIDSLIEKREVKMIDNYFCSVGNEKY